MLHIKDILIKQDKKTEKENNHSNKTVNKKLKTIIKESSKSKNRR